MIRNIGHLETVVGSRELEVSVAYTDENISAKGVPIIFLHGCGRSSTDFADAGEYARLAERRRLTFDFPGHGSSPYPDRGDITVDNTVEIVHDLTFATGIGRIALVGHGLGGLVAVRFAMKYPYSTAGIINVEGSMGPEDCFTTDRVASEKMNGDSLSAKLARSPSKGFRQYTAGLVDVNERAHIALAHSAIEHCARGDAFAGFVELELPRLFMYGEGSADSLPYLTELRRHGVELYGVPGSDHFPMIDNPADFYTTIDNFVCSLDGPYGPLH